MNYEQFLKAWSLTPRDKNLREGQQLMNFLWLCWEEEYKRISSIHYYDETDIDCFYVDNLIPNTLAHLKKVWYNYPN